MLAAAPLPQLHAAAQKVGADDDKTGVETATEVAEAQPSTITAPGGVPLEAAPSHTAVDSVKASMARITKQAAAGVPENYALEFGDTFDWVRVDSGEWLKGKLKEMRDDKLEFESHKFDTQDIDFTDVSEIHSPHVFTYVLEDQTTAIGRGVITADKVIVETDEGTKTFDRSKLEAILSGGKREKEWWSMKLGFGLTLNRGNNDQLTYDITFNVRREDRLTLLDFNYQASFGRTSGVQNVNRHLGEFLFQVFLKKPWFVVPALAQFFNDRFQNIRFRTTPAAGAGVHIIDVTNVKWDFLTGMGYQYLNYSNASQVTEGNPQNDAFIPLYTYADFNITDDIELTASWLTNLVFTTIGNTNHTGKADLSIDVTFVIDLDISFLYLRTEDPAPAPDPTAPAIKKNDYQIVVSLSLELG